MRVELICGKCSHLMPSEVLETGYVRFTCVICEYFVDSPNVLYEVLSQ